MLRLARKRRKRLRKLKILSRHPIVVPVVTFGVLFVLTAAGYLLFFRTPETARPVDTRIVIISYDKQKRIVPARPQTVEHLLKKLRITINPGDVVEPEVDTHIVQDNFRINIYRAKPVQIVDNQNQTFAFSAATTPRSVAAAAGVTVYAEDKVEARPVTNFLRQGAIGEQVVVSRSVPVNLNLYGTAAPTRTLAKTVGQLMKEKGITLSKGASVMPGVKTPITANMQVFILKKGVTIVSDEETVPTPTEQVDDNNLTFGTRAIRQRGSPGKQLVTYQVTLNPATGAELSRQVIQTVVTVDPIPQIVAIGKYVAIPADKTQIMAAAGIAVSDYKYVDYIISHESGWCATKAQGQYGNCPPYTGYVPSSGGYGLCQSTPPGKMASAGADWRTNPVTQMRWCDGYAQGRYGSWQAAYERWLRTQNW